VKKGRPVSPTAEIERRVAVTAKKISWSKDFFGTSQQYTDEVFTVLHEHFPDEEDDFINLLAQVLASALRANSNNRIGKPFEVEVSRELAKLKKLQKSLPSTISALDSLDDLGREILSRQMMGLFEPESFTGYYNPISKLRYQDRLEDVVAQLKRLDEHVAAVLRLANAELGSIGRGAPPKDGAREIACLCALCFKDIAQENPPSPSWAPYREEAEGSFYSLVKDIFKVGHVNANPEEYARQASVWAKEN